MKRTNLWLSLAAIVAISALTFSLTACGSDDDDDKQVVSIYKQWELTASPNPERIASAIYDLSEQGIVRPLTKYTAEAAAEYGLSADKYYIGMEAACTITMNADGKSGVIWREGAPIGMEFSDLTATSVTIEGRACKAVSKKIVGEALPE